MTQVGILALQGGYQRHADLLDQLGVAWRWVRSARDLENCTALILPGGESTAITHLLQIDGLFELLKVFARTHPTLGSCAGLILMGQTDDTRVQSLELLDISISRNAYGRQSQSFQHDIEVGLDLGQGNERFPAVFIRAPQIIRVGHAVTVLARHEGNPVLVAQGLHLGMSFHPELTGDTRIHRYWLARAKSELQRVPRNEACA
jgi:5'-phosphate synthase pdxT subunit